MKIVLLSLLMVFQAFADGNSESGRFRLVKTHHDYNKKKSTGLYYDPVEQRIISKTYSWKDSFETYRRGQNSGFEFPKVIKSFAEVSPMAISAGYNIKVSYSYHPLNSIRGVSNARKKIATIIGKDTANSIIRNAIGDINKNHKNYKLVTVFNKGDDDLAVYYNGKKGSFIFKSVDRDRRATEKYKFPLKMSLQQNVSPDDKKYALEKNIEYPARTLYEFNKAIAGISKQHDRFGVTFSSSDLLKQYKKKLQTKMKGFILINEINYRDRLRKVFYNFTTNEIIYQEVKKNNDDRYYLMEEKVYSLNDEYGFSQAQDYLAKKKVIGEIEFDNFRDLYIGSCSELNSQPLLNTNLNNISNITDRLFEQYLQSSVSNSVIIAEEKTVISTVNILDVPYQLNILYGFDGTISSVKFLNPKKASLNGVKIILERDSLGDKHFHLKAIDPSDNIEKSFIIATSEKPEKSTLGYRGNLVLYVGGQKGTKQFSYNGYEKNKYVLNFKNDFSQISSSEKRQRLQGHERNEYDLTMNKGGGGGFLGFLFHTFYSKDKQFRTVRDNIATEAGKTLLSNKDFKYLTNQAEINDMADRIATNAKLKTNNYAMSLSKIEAVVAAESYSVFGELLLRRILANILPAEKISTVQHLVDQSLSSFKNCLARSNAYSEKKNADKCMKTFESEAAVDLGRSLLELKLIENGMGLDLALSVREYNKCIKEKYDPIVNKSINESIAPNAIVKACMFKVLLLSIDKNTEKLIESKLEAVNLDGSAEVKLTRAQMDSTLKLASKCTKDKGLTDKNSYDMIFDIKYLSRISPTKFEQELSECISNLTSKVGRLVTRQVLMQKVTNALLTDRQSINKENSLLIEAVVNSGLSNGYDYCTNLQRKKITIATEKYNVEKIRLEALRAYPDQGVIVNVYIPPLDLEACQEMISSLSISEVAISKISTMMGPDLWSSLTDDEQAPEFLKCFSDRKLENIKNLNEKFSRKPIWYDLPQAKQTEVKISNRKMELLAADRADAKCLKQGVVWGAFHLAQDMLQESFVQMKDDFGDISITADQNKLLALKIQLCFKNQLADKNSIQEVAEAINIVSDYCTVNLLKNDDDFKNIVLKPILLHSLTEAGVHAADKEFFATILSTEFTKYLNDENVASLEDFRIKSSGFKSVATIKIIELTLDKTLNQLVKDKLTEQEIAAFKLRLNPRLQDLIHGGNLTLLNKLKQAYASGDKEAPNKLIAEFTLDATKIVSGEAILIEAKELVKNNTLSEQNLTAFVAFSKRIMKQCLSQVKTQNPDKVEAQIDMCTAKVKEKATLYVVEVKIKEEFQTPSLKGLFAIDVQQELIDKILNSDLKLRVKAISLIRDPIKSEKSMKLLISDLTVDASKTIASKLISISLEQSIPIGDQKDEENKQYIIQTRKRLATSASLFFDSCMDEVKEKSQAVINDNSEIYLENGEEFDSKKDAGRCINLIRLETSVAVINYQLAEALKLINNDASRNQALIDKELITLRACANILSPYSDSGQYTDELDGCLSQTIIDITLSAVVYARSIGSDLLRPNKNTIFDLNKCFEQINDKLFEKLKSEAPTNNLLLSTLDKRSILSNKEQLTYAFKISRELHGSEADKKIRIYTILSEVKECSLNKLLPNLIDEYKESLFSNKTFKLNSSQKNVVESLLSHSKNLLQMKDLSGAQIQFNTKINGLELDSSMDKTVLELMREYTPMIVKYLKQSEFYDNQGIQKEIDEVMNAIKADVIANNYKLDINRVIDLLLKSKLSDRIIKGFIATEIKTSAKASLNKFITNKKQLDTVVTKLSSKKMINRIFSDSDPDTKRLFDNIKNGYIRKILNGTNLGTSPAREVMWPIKLKLAKDTKIGGFAETILAPIAQSELTDGKGSFSGGFGRLIGRVESSDFNWYHIRSRSGSQRVISQFSKNILQPTLTYGLSNDKMVAAKEKLGEKISELVKNNGEDYNPFW
jgi:hypothetical protein